jgi:hypothetical protein
LQTLFFANFHVLGLLNLKKKKFEAKNTIRVSRGIASVSTQWEIISITSIEVDFWGVKNSVCENSLAKEVKCSNIPQKS